MSYQEAKEIARQKAIDWQTAFAESDHSWADLAEAFARFERLGRRYGLLREFRENGIL